MTSAAESPATTAPEPTPLAGHAPVSPEAPLFSSFSIRPEIITSLKGVGIERTFAIQELTLPIALAGQDLIGQARTGTGKTLGFGVPMLNRITVPSPAGAAPQALVIAPTRELAVQVAGDLTAAGKDLKAKVVTIYGGRAYEPQVAALKAGCDVVVGTPGRLLDLSQQGHLVLGNVRCLVLDEADEMLDLGFLPDIEKLMAMLPAARQTMLFSATMPGPIVSLARQFLNQPMQIRAENTTEIPATEHVEQFVYRAHAMDKAEVVARILQANGRGLTMIFTRTKRTAQKVADDLVERGFAAGAVHGDLGQGAREQALRAFRSGKVDVLVATDVAARGLDVDDVTHVINYQCPEDAMTYVHRIGRTARAGKSGTAVTLVDWDDLPKWKLICDTLSLPFHEPAETYSTSEHLYLELDIPSKTGSSLPVKERTRAGLDAEAIEDLGGSKPRSSGGDRKRAGSATSSSSGSGRGTSGGASRSGSGSGSGSGGSGSGASASGSGSSGSGSTRSRTRSRGGAAASGPSAGSAESGGETAKSRQGGERNRRRRRTRGGDTAEATPDNASGSAG
ncbi:DEAD/DEAH box helicase [Jatrophihabitans telluris]|uniref:RNA helicase n=1 Tax=Jatrophihabitans telluris TaxID=2038343 RepID=A0ABY4R1B3_9ACTN|nr:DEAD/DEAH box helicase [Jatrophihabitans telluris]UQX89711.1 DEAD/DEAH box helicase [Jatrophihabitans telluris]